MQKLAFLTVGILHEPFGHAVVQGFIDRVPEVYAAADASHGFQARSVRDMTSYRHSWGEVVLPACYPQLDDTNRYAMTLSLWNDVESVAAFAYHGPHSEALKLRGQWFERHKLPNHVAWWVDADHAVDWAEGAERLDYLHRDGPSAYAFSLSQPFDSVGRPVSTDRALVLQKAQANMRPPT